METLGDLMLQVKLDADAILAIDGIGPKSHEEILETVNNYQFPVIEPEAVETPEAETVAEPEPAEVVEEPEAVSEPEPAEEAEPAAEASASEQPEAEEEPIGRGRTRCRG